MTGITLPLVSYGGSSIMCTIIMLSIIQGLYILRKDENREELAELRQRIEKERMEQEKRWQEEEQRQKQRTRSTRNHKQTIPEYQDELARRIEKKTEEGIAFRDH